MSKTVDLTNSWLEKTINKDYAQIVHDLVMEAFNGFPHKKLKRSIAKENLTELNGESTRSSSCSDSAYATSEDDLLEVNIVGEEIPCFESDDDTLVDEGESSRSESVKSFYQKRTSGDEVDKDSLLYNSHEDICKPPTSAKKLNYPEENSLAESSINSKDVSCLLESSNYKFAENTATKEKPDYPEENLHIADSSIGSRDVSCLLESSNNKFAENTATKEKPNYPEENLHIADSSIGSQDVSCLLGSSNYKFAENTATKEKPDYPEENLHIADSSIGSGDVSCLLESSSYKFPENDKATASKQNPNYSEISDSKLSFRSKSSHEENLSVINAQSNLAEQLEYEETIGKIYSEESRIKQLHHLLDISKSQSGYIGSIPHLAASTKMLIANLTKDALIVSIAKKYFEKPPLNRISYPKGQIVVQNLQLDTECLGNHGNLPSCYYLIVLQHNTTVLHTEILAPDAHGIVEWNDKMMFDDISHNFTIFMSLYKLQLKSNIKNYKWKKLLKTKRQLPLFQLVGKKEITKSNIHKTAFDFNNNELLYGDFNLLIHTGKDLTKTAMKLSKVVMKSNRATKVICNNLVGQLDGTDLILFQADVPQEVISMLRCKRCKTYSHLINTLEIEYEKTHCSGKFYLTFENAQQFREWRMVLNGAMLVSKKWNL